MKSNHRTPLKALATVLVVLGLIFVPALAIPSASHAADTAGGGGSQTGSDSNGGGGSQTGTLPNGGGGSQTGTLPNGGGGSQTGGSGGGVFSLTNPLHAQSIGELVLDVIQIFSYVAVLFGALAIIWVGFQYILASSQGNADKIKELHGYFLAIIIGLAIVIGASAIIHVLLNTLKATGTVNQSIINSANKAAQFK